MARPKKDNVEYFPMFCIPSKTTQILENKYGNDGYAFFYKLLQILGNEYGHYYDCRNAIDFEFLAGKMGFSSRKLQEMLDDLKDWGKIDKKLWENKIIWYQGFVDTLKNVYSARTTKVPTKEDCIKKTGVFLDNIKENNSFLEENPDNLSFSSINPPENPQSKVKYSKLEGEKKEKRETPSLQKIKNYCLEKNYRSNPEKFYYKHQETGWIDKNGNPIIDWQARLDRFENEDFPKAEIKTIASFNATKAQDFGINQAQYNSYIAPLRIKINSNKSLATIACPGAFHIIQIRNGEHGCPIDENILKKVLKVNRVAYEDYDKNYDKNIDAMA